MLKTLWIFALCLPLASHAAVYKCSKDGKSMYTDKPCDASAQPANLPALTVTKPVETAALAKQYDDRLRREKASRDRHYASDVQAQAAQASRSQALRSAMIDHRILPGMSPSEVRSSLGVPSDEASAARWVYRSGNSERTVTFGPNGVINETSKTLNTKSHARHKR